MCSDYVISSFLLLVYMFGVKNHIKKRMFTGDKITKRPISGGGELWWANGALRIEAHPPFLLATDISVIISINRYIVMRWLEYALDPSETKWMLSADEIARSSTKMGWNAWMLHLCMGNFLKYSQIITPFSLILPLATTMFKVKCRLTNANICTIKSQP